MEQDDKRITELVNKLMDADNLEKAPVDFTQNVMSQIEALSKSKATEYKPLIPKIIWWILGVGFVALLSYTIFSKPSTSEPIVDRYNLPELSLNFLEGMTLNLSNTLMYAMVFLVIMISIQIPILKQYFNKRLVY
ncbi:hypothetical protein [Winogradskyella vincentii]|uniref:Uncharacterized protein n=1 Tax=Winogradskyella vincentii TaxID=2877122 RepID=A0ABS7Y6R9_9FLAO|nr:hypothetical protein [Winogradskyella vincentii]MCA0154497.1 hypothetical protein [Winogradskyella vincentii]